MPLPPTSLPTSLPAPTARHRVHRAADRAHYDADTIHRIIDAAYVCHVSWSDGDKVLCIPTACWRIGHHLYIHGSNGSRMMQNLADGMQACVAITLLDGLVLAKSAFAHSMNYRSVVIHGRFHTVGDTDKPAALQALTEWLLPGRSQQARVPNVQELQATTVLALPLHEAAAKIRSWGPKDKEGDLDWPCWSGVLPMQMQAMPPQTFNEQAETPRDVVHWSEGAVIRN